MTHMNDWKNIIKKSIMPNLLYFCQSSTLNPQTSLFSVLRQLFTALYGSITILE